MGVPERRIGRFGYPRAPSGWLEESAGTAVREAEPQQEAEELPHDFGKKVAAGGTADGVMGGINEMWETRYKESVRGGNYLVGVHSEDGGDVERAAKLPDRRRRGPRRTLRPQGTPGGMSRA